MPKGKRPSITDILAVHGTAEEKQAFATAMMASDINATSDILAAIKRRLRASQPARKPSTRRIDNGIRKALAKRIEKYGREAVVQSIARVLAEPPVDMTKTVSASDGENGAEVHG